MSYNEPMELTKKEVALVIALRKISYGIVEVHKVNGEPVRLVSKESISLTDQDGEVILSKEK